jgi:RCC1 and BTB domain-containing protein
VQGKGIRAVACGGFHSVALSDTGSVYCWGGGDKGQLGLGNDKSQTLPCVVDALQVPTQSKSQKLKSAAHCNKLCSEQNKTVVSVSCGMHHTAALLDSGDMYLWGAGECVSPACQVAAWFVCDLGLIVAAGTADSGSMTSSSRTRRPCA